MSGIFAADIKPVERPVIPARNVRQYAVRENGLLYLETSSGDLYTTESEIRVFTGEGEDRSQIWCMQTFGFIDPKALHTLGIAAITVHAFLKETRSLGLERTLEKIKRSEDFCLLDFPMRSIELVDAGQHVSGTLVYRENIIDNLSRFMGSEVIDYRDTEHRPARVPLFEAYIQGGRT